MQQKTVKEELSELLATAGIRSNINYSWHPTFRGADFSLDMQLHYGEGTEDYYHCNVQLSGTVCWRGILRFKNNWKSYFTLLEDMDADPESIERYFQGMIPRVMGWNSEIDFKQLRVLSKDGRCTTNISALFAIDEEGFVKGSGAFVLEGTMHVEAVAALLKDIHKQTERFESRLPV